MRLLPWILPLAVFVVSLAAQVTGRGGRLTPLAYAAIFHFVLLFAVLGLVTRLGAGVRAAIAVALPAVLAAALWNVTVAGRSITGGTSAAFPLLAPGLFFSEWFERSDVADRLRDVAALVVTPDLARVDLLSAADDAWVHFGIDHVVAREDGALLVAWTVSGRRVERRAHRLSVVRPDGTVDPAPPPPATVSSRPWLATAAPAGAVLAYHEEISRRSPALLLDASGAVIRELRPAQPLQLATPLRLGPDGRLQSIVADPAPRLVALELGPEPRLVPVRDLDAAQGPVAGGPVDHFWTPGGGLAVVVAAGATKRDDGLAAGEGRRSSIVTLSAAGARGEERPLPPGRWRLLGVLDDATPLLVPCSSRWPLDASAWRIPILVLRREGATLLTERGNDGRRGGEEPWPTDLRALPVGDLDVAAATPAPGGRIALLLRPVLRGPLSLQVVDAVGSALEARPLRPVGPGGHAP